MLDAHDDLFANKTGAELGSWPSAGILDPAPVDDPPPPRHGAMLEGQVTVGLHRVWACVLALVALVVAGDVGAQPGDGEGGTASDESSDQPDSGAAPVGAAAVDELVDGDGKLPAPPPAPGCSSEADCPGRQECRSGRCELPPGSSMAPVAPAVDCPSSVGCRKAGHCTASGDRCVAAVNDDCKLSEACRRDGRCVASDGRCVAPTERAGQVPPARRPVHGAAPWRLDPRCAEEDDCREDGECVFLAGECSAGFDEDCRRSRLCRERGRCSAVEGRCVATHPMDCQASSACAEKDQCFLNVERRVCDDGLVWEDRQMLLAGILTTAIGGSVALGGVTSLLLYATEEKDAFLPLGVVLMVAGGVSTIVGIPLMASGGSRVPKQEGVSAVPAVAIGPTGGSLTWRF